MVQVDWAGPALDDLQDIHQFIARDSQRYARMTIERITQVAGSLAVFPQLGQVLPEFGPAYREIVVGAYRLIYREDLERNRVVIAAVIHARRDLPPILEDR
jgi:toxin ParE1/3/4